MSENWVHGDVLISPADDTQGWNSKKNNFMAVTSIISSIRSDVID